MSSYKLLLIAFGPIAAFITYFLLPAEYLSISGSVAPLPFASRATIAMMVWMGLWWLTEAVELSTTALLPIALFPVLGIGTIKSVSAPYASDLVFLFLGGFIFAHAMQHQGLDKRIAFNILSVFGTKPPSIVAGFMFATALLSAFISNTATTVIMLPMALSVLMLVKDQLSSSNKDSNARDATNLGVCMLLGIAYAASVGGIATIIGTPPNLIAVSFIKDSIDPAYRQDISFLKWMIFGTPIVICMLPITWFLLTRILFPIQNHSITDLDTVVKSGKAKLGPMSYAEKIILIVFTVTVIFWMSRTFIQDISFSIQGKTIKPFSNLSDAGIAIFSSMLMFIISAKNRPNEPILQWKHLQNLPWGVIILFGGSLSLAEAIQSNGVAEFIGAQASYLPAMPSIFYIALVVGVIIFLSELASNTAIAATFIPILGASAIGLNMHPYMVILPATIAASYAFMLPAGTPPNAIVFGTGHIKIQDMYKAGFWLDIISVIIITLVCIVLLPAIGIV